MHKTKIITPPSMTTINLEPMGTSLKLAVTDKKGNIFMHAATNIIKDNN